MDRLQRHHHLHRRAVRVGDDALGGDRSHRGSPRRRPAARSAPSARRSSCRRPRSPLGEARRPLARDRPPAENSATSNPLIGSAPSTRTSSSRRRTRSSYRPSARRRRAPPRTPAARARPSRRASSADRAGRAHDHATRSSRLAHARRPSSARRRPRRARTPSCSACDRVRNAIVPITHEILIGEVEIISMLIAVLAEHWKTFAATPGWFACPPRSGTPFPSPRPRARSRGRSRAASGSSVRRAARRSSFGTVKESSARCTGDTGSFWMIMSTLMSASASAPKIRPATPGWSGTPVSVTRASVGRVGHGCDERSFHRLLSPRRRGYRSLSEARPDVDPHAVVAGVLDRAQLQHARARGRHLEHLLERDEGQLAGVRDDPRVGREDSVHVGVDLAHLGAERGGERDRGRVRAAAAERRHVA